MSGSFSLRLAAGTYQLPYCPNTKKQNSPFTVTLVLAALSFSLLGYASSDAPTTAYRSYVVAQVDELVTKTKAFAAAVTCRGRRQGQAGVRLDPLTTTRRIEPVAESFGDLDPEIDARRERRRQPRAMERFPQDRAGAIPPQQNTLTGMAPYASELDADVTKPAAAGGQGDLSARPSWPTVRSSSSTKSRRARSPARRSVTATPTWWDFEGNLDGSLKTIDLLRPALKQSAPDLLTEIDAQGAVVRSALARYAATPGYDATGYVSYDTVTTAQRRQLSQVVNALGALIAQVPVKVTR